MKNFYNSFERLIIAILPFELRDSSSLHSWVEQIMEAHLFSKETKSTPRS